jgi:hypothetical protein
MGIHGLKRFFAFDFARGLYEFWQCCGGLWMRCCFDLAILRLNKPNHCLLCRFVGMAYWAAHFSAAAVV